MMMMKLMSKVLVAGVLIALAATSFVAVAQTKTEQHSDKEIKEDITRHRAMAAAHEGAAKCLEAGKGEDACMKELQASCKGLGIGKYCGMRHVH
jgi:Tfp pilus assembly protein FimT